MTRVECSGQRARRPLQTCVILRQPLRTNSLFWSSQRRLLGFRRAVLGRSGDPLWLLFPIEGELASATTGVAKVHEPVQQAANATLSQAGNVLPRKVRAQERACTNRSRQLKLVWFPWLQKSPLGCVNTEFLIRHAVARAHSRFDRRSLAIMESSESPDLQISHEKLSTSWVNTTPLSHRPGPRGT